MVIEGPERGRWVAGTNFNNRQQYKELDKSFSTWAGIVLQRGGGHAIYYCGRRLRIWRGGRNGYRIYNAAKSTVNPGLATVTCKPISLANLSRNAWEDFNSPCTKYTGGLFLNPPTQ